MLGRKVRMVSLNWDLKDERERGKRKRGLEEIKASRTQQTKKKREGERQTNYQNACSG